MEFENYRNKIKNVVSRKTKSLIRIDVDVKKRVFQLKSLIFHARNSLSPSVKKYVQAREGKFFQPHSTFFFLEGEEKVALVQEIPFQWGFQPVSLKGKICEFCKMSQKCREMLMEMAIEDS